MSGRDESNATAEGASGAAKESSRPSLLARSAAARGAVYVSSLALVLLGVAYLLPSSWDVSRSVRTQASPEAVFAHLQPLGRWMSWFPWNATLDPSASLALETPGDTGATELSWSGDKIGRGRLKITRAAPSSVVEFEQSLQDGRYLSRSSITLERHGAVTTITWRDRGSVGLHPVGRYFTLLMNSALGPGFESGLRGLATLAEADEGYASMPEPDTEDAGSEPAGDGDADEPQGSTGGEDSSGTPE